MTNAAKPTCPNCHAAVPAGARQCSVCKLEVSQMRAFAAAKMAARRKGLATTEVEEASPPFYQALLRPVFILPLVICAAIVLFFVMRPAKADPWQRLPASQMDAAKEFLTHISKGTDDGYEKAYGLVAPSVKRPKDSEELGKYRQLYHVMNNYLATEFGKDWITLLNLQADPANNEFVLAKIGPETLHLRITQEVPPEKMKGDADRRYGVHNIEEFDIEDAAALQKAAGIMGIVRGVAGAGAENNLQTIMGARGGNRRESKMQTKLRILPNLRNPRAVVRMTVINAWPVRTDPVIRARLDQISKDGRYPNDVQQTARDVLADNISDEELIAAGVE
jgi:hypothetical protein